MNSLSWFLYSIDLFSNISILAQVAALALVICFVAMVIAGSVMRSDSYDSDAAVSGEKLHKAALRKVLPTIVIVSIVACLIPTKETMYMIGASQIGEQIVALEEVQSMGGEVGSLAKETVTLLRKKVQEATGASE